MRLFWRRIQEQTLEHCLDHEAVRIDKNKENSFLKFDSGQYQFKVPFVIYAIFKMLPQSSEEETDPDPLNSYTRDIIHHIISRFCAYTMFMYGEVEDPLRTYGGKDCIEVFCNHIKEEAKRLYHMFPEKPTGPLVPEHGESSVG